MNFINDRLVAKIGKEKAARETEEDFAGDRWWWIDDNAKSMEVFSMPGVYEQYKDTTDGMVDFIYDTSRDGMCRRETRILRRSIVGGGWGNCERNPENLAKTKHKKKKHTAQEGRPGIKKVSTLTLIFFPQPDPTSHRIRVPVFAMIPIWLMSGSGSSTYQM